MFTNMDTDGCLLLCVLQVVGTFHGAFSKWVSPWGREDSLEVSELQTMHVLCCGVLCACVDGCVQEHLCMHVYGYHPLPQTVRTQNT